MDREQEEENCGGQPVSPSSQSLSTSLLSLCIYTILEFEQPIVEIEQSKKSLADALMPKNPRFSCLLEEDEKGVLRWKKTKVNIDDHVIIPEFPPGHHSYDTFVSEYISNLCQKPFDPSRPPWEFHILNYKTNRAEGMLIVKIHHAIGDGISLMSALFSCVNRADNPTLPVSFPAKKKIDVSRAKKTAGNSNWSILNYIGRLWFLVLVLCYTVVDVAKSVIRMTGWMEDSTLPIRGPPGVVELLPLAISSAEFPLEDIKQIKTAIGGVRNIFLLNVTQTYQFSYIWFLVFVQTVNDVLVGIIFCGVQRYLQICLSTGEEKKLQVTCEKGFKPNASIIKQMKNLKVTTISVINIRAFAGVENLNDMMKPNAQIPWGNHFGLLHLQIPLENIENPLEFVTRAKRIVDRHKMSLAIYVLTKILGLIGRLKGPQALATFLYKTLASTTLGITNMIGPLEKMAIGKNIIKRFTFFVSGVPQALDICILSYMGTVTLQVISREPYVNGEMISNLLKEAFEEIKEASIHHNLKISIHA